MNDKINTKIGIYIRKYKYQLKLIILIYKQLKFVFYISIII